MHKGDLPQNVGLKSVRVTACP